MKNVISILSLCLIFVSLTEAAVAKDVNLKKFKTKEALCAYIEEKKDNAESLMRQSYKANQYNKLEADRKYWKGLYVDRCFD